VRGGGGRVTSESSSHVLGGMPDGAGHVGGKHGFDMGKIKRARDVLGGVVKDHREMDRQGAEHPAHLIGAV
jgi:hypothetical protein